MTPRHQRLVELARTGPEPRVDVGADHGHVAAALGAVATEREPGRTGRSDVPWVVADGLRPFRRVGTAVIAGMGARTIARILAHAPPIAVAVLHAQDDPPSLRVWLAANGWRIDREVLAPEARAYAEILRVERGTEPASGLVLEYGPVLLAGDDPWLVPHLMARARVLERLLASPALPDPVRADAEARLAFLREVGEDARRRTRAPAGPPAR